jgi:hypothetical protein
MKLALGMVETKGLVGAMKRRTPWSKRERSTLGKERSAPAS